MTQSAYLTPPPANKCIKLILKYVLIFCRNNSIACLRAKAQEHQARLLNNGGLFLQVRRFAQGQAQIQDPSDMLKLSEEHNNNSPIPIPPAHSTVNTQVNVKMELTANGGSMKNYEEA